MPAPQKSFQQVLRELLDLLQTYAKQQTLDPLRNLGRHLGLGLAGSFVVALGVLLLGLGILRGLATHVPFMRDHNYLPILITALFWLAAMLVVWARLRRSAPEVTS